MQDGIGSTGQVSYNYDPIGELTSQTDEFGVTTSYTYDLVGNKISISYPGTGHVVTRIFNGANEMTSVTTWLAGPGTCGTYDITTDTTTFTYDLDGNLVSTTLPNCDAKNTPVSPDVINRTYDYNNKLTDLYGTWQGKNDSIQYTNSGLGTIMNRNINSGALVTSYSYNSASQILSSTTGTTTENFQYDAAGNLTCNQAGQNLVYSSLGELTDSYSACNSTTSQVDTYSYDAYGDRITTTFPFDGQQDTENYYYMNSIGERVGYAVFFTLYNYTYSGNGQLMQKTRDSVVQTQMTWDEASSTPKILSDGVWDFIYGPDGNAVEAINSPNSTPTPAYLLNDATGSVIANFSLNGTINNLTFYDTWGASTQSSAPPIGWDNAYYDQASGLYYLNNRWYDSNTGQFTTQDPRTLATNQPWGYGGVASPASGGQAITAPSGIDQTQIYQFANDNPVSERDMTGLCSNRCQVLSQATENFMSSTLMPGRYNVASAGLLAAGDYIVNTTLGLTSSIFPAFGAVLLSISLLELAVDAEMMTATAKVCGSG